MIYNHYKTKGLDAYYTKQFMDGMGVEGGGGHYGSTSGGFDQIRVWYTNVHKRIKYYFLKIIMRGLGIYLIPFVYISK